MILQGVNIVRALRKLSGRKEMEFWKVNGKFEVQILMIPKMPWFCEPLQMEWTAHHAVGNHSIIVGSVKIMRLKSRRYI